MRDSDSKCIVISPNGTIRGGKSLIRDTRASENSNPVNAELGTGVTTSNSLGSASIKTSSL